MRCERFTDPALLSLGTMDGVRLDYHLGNLSAYGQPAIVPDVDTASSVVSTFQALAMLGNENGLAEAWSFPGAGAIKSSQSGDYAQWSTTAYAIDINYGVDTSYGAIAHVYIDQQPYPGFSSLAASNPAFRINLDGAQHTVKIVVRTDAQAGAQIISPITDVVGTMSRFLALKVNGTPIQAGTFTVTGHYTGGSYTATFAAGPAMVPGSSSDAVQPGLTVSIAAGATWNDGDHSTFTVTAPSLQLSSATSYPNLLTTSTYTTPVLDSGKQGTEWPYIQFNLGPVGAPLPTLSLGVGETSTPDSSWSWVDLIPSSYDNPDGDWTTALYGGQRARGRFAVAKGTISSPATRSWISGIQLYHWVPEADPFLARFPAEFYDVGGDGTFMDLATSLAALMADGNLRSRELKDGAAISSSGIFALKAYGDSLRIPRRYAETNASYQARLVSYFRGRNNGGSDSFLTSVLSAYAGVPVLVQQASHSTVQWIVGQNTLGINTILGSQRYGFWHYNVVVPFTGLQVSPDDMALFVELLRPIGHIATIVYT